MNHILAFASDHAGYALKQQLMQWANEHGRITLDIGSHSENSVDYPDFGYKLAKAIKTGKADMGVAICGSGIGISMAANRFNHIRAALCQNEEMATLARQHNDANVLALAARVTSKADAQKILSRFLQTPFEGGRHATRVQKLSNPPL